MLFYLELCVWLSITESSAGSNLGENHTIRDANRGDFKKHRRAKTKHHQSPQKTLASPNFVPLWVFPTVTSCLWPFMVIKWSQHRKMTQNETWGTKLPLSPSCECSMMCLWVKLTIFMCIYGNSWKRKSSIIFSWGPSPLSSLTLAGSVLARLGVSLLAVWSWLTQVNPEDPFCLIKIHYWSKHNENS